jgi:tetratricopeptide (TPR) repeat protein
MAGKMAKHAHTCYLFPDSSDMNSQAKKHVEYASGYLDLMMYDECVRECDAALQVDAENRHAVALKSAALWQANRLKEAEPCMARLAELAPHESTVWINLAYIRRRTQSLEAAVETLQRAFEANPQDALAHFNMACYRAMQNRQKEAMALLTNALKLDPKLRELARAERDLESLHPLPEFQNLIKSISPRR